jgi:hypothetical protein
MTTPVAATPAIPARPKIFQRGCTRRVGYRGVDHPTLTLNDAVDIASTGDIWLFRGRSAADLAIRAVTNSPVNHVGMVVAIDDLPPLLWHAELGRSLPDVWTGQRQRGVQLHHLREAVTTWNTRCCPPRGAWRTGTYRRARQELLESGELELLSGAGATSRVAPKPIGPSLPRGACLLCLG